MTHLKMLLGAAAASTALLAAGAAQAAPVSVSDLQNQTIGGENCNFSFAGLAGSDGTGGTLVLHAQGDFDHGGLGAGTEYLDWDAEGIVGATGVGDCNGNVCQGGPFDFVTVFQPLGNVEFQVTYTLSGAELDALLADSVVNIFVDLEENVGLFNPPNFVEFTLNYNSGTPAVPLPAALPLLIGGIGALGALGRRRKSRTA